MTTWSNSDLVMLGIHTGAPIGLLLLLTYPDGEPEWLKSAAPATSVWTQVTTSTTVWS